MPSLQPRSSREPAVAKPEVAAAEILAWVSDCIEGGLCLMARGILVCTGGKLFTAVAA